MKPINFRVMDCANIGVFVDGEHLASIHFWLPNRPEWASVEDTWDNIDGIARCLNELMDESDHFKPLIHFIHDYGKDFVRIEFEEGFEIPLGPTITDLFGNTKDHTGLVVNSFKPVWDREQNKVRTPIGTEKATVERQNADDAIWFMNQLVWAGVV